MREKTRVEVDSFGRLEIPAAVYYGIQTYRAMELLGHPKESYGNCSRNFSDVVTYQGLG